MKTLIKNIWMAWMLILPFGCTDLLDEESHTEIEKKGYMHDATEAETVLLGVYKNMSTDALYGYHLSILFALGTDMEQVEGSTNENFRVIPTNSFTSSESEIQNTWATLYNGIYNANDFLETISQRIHEYNDTGKRLGKVYIAEARALRALYYFELVRRFGNIVLMTNTAMSKQHPSTFTQSDPEMIYQFIEEDLLHAVDNLPYAIDDNVRSSNEYRFSKGAALGLLSKVYATWAGYPLCRTEKWENAAKTAKILIESNKHALLSNFETLWFNAGSGTWDASESLIEASFYSPTASAGSDPVGRIGKWNGVKATAIAGERGSNAGNVKVVHTFVLEWREHPADLRREISVANYRYNPQKELWVFSASDTPETAAAKDLDPAKGQKQKQYYTPGKWDTEKYVGAGNKLINNDKSNVNWYVLRYAEVLLLYAEALNEWKQGPIVDAYTVVNMVRRRGFGLPVTSNSSVADLPADLSYIEFQKAVRKERGYELAFEGHRRQDLIRWGIYYETIKATAQTLGSWWTSTEAPNYVVAKPGYTIKGKHELFPIPQRDKDLMKQCKQNPYW